MDTRKCPECNNIISYSSKSGYYAANKNNSVCRKCASIKSGFISRFATKGENLGQNNPFYGQKHTNKTKKIISQTHKGRKKTKEELLKMSKNSSGSNNPMYNKTAYDIWVSKYGKIEADIKEQNRKRKLSKANSGKKNPMYGKPSPNGSGNGWKGWFRQHFFRSLRELAYMIYLNDNNISWINGETISIKYKFCKKNRTYRPDFIIGNKVVEIKPQKLHNTPNVTAKIKSLKKYCIKNNLTYEIIDIIIDKLKIEENIKNNNIKFMKKYEDKYNLWIKN